MSFTVFARARPIRTAFLFADAAGFDGLCDGLVTWSTNTWGGRQSAIALLQEDDTISEDGMQELVRFDPDHIYLLAPLSDKLLKKLDEELAPWHITEPVTGHGTEVTSQAVENPATWHEENIQAPGVPTPPTLQNLAALQKRRLQQSPLLLFEFGKDCPPLFRRFIHRNLGTYDQWYEGRTGAVRRVAWMERMLSGISFERLRVDDLGSFCEALGRISGCLPGEKGKPPISFTAPCELSGIYLNQASWWGVFQYTYRVIVGSDLRDFSLYWRSCMNGGAGVWDAPFRHCLLIPTELMREASFAAVLHRWLYYFAGQGNSNYRTVELTSASLSSDDLSLLVGQWRAGTFPLRARSITAEDLEARWRKERTAQNSPQRFIPHLNGNNAERLLAVERTQAWELRPPELIQAEVPTGTWAVDVQIERESQAGRLKEQDWWVLPRRSGAVLVQAMFRAPARITQSGLFSVQIEQASTWPGTPNPAGLQLRLPDDSDVVPAVLMDLGYRLYSDARREGLRKKSAVARIEISDAGRKLRGLIELFGGFWRAQDYWARSFWREIFYRMSGRGGRYDSALRIQTEQVAEKELRRLIPTASEVERHEAAKRIGQRVLGLVGERLPGLAMSFAQMEEERARFEQLHVHEQAAGEGKEIEYLAGDTIVHMAGIGPVTSDELKGGLRDLVTLGVLRMGMEVRCSRCRLQHWIATDLLRQSNECSGCGTPTILPPETEWTYRLNSLVHHCVNSRALAVWQALAELSYRPPGSFFFAPSSEVYFQQPIDRSAKKELDVLCVTDGKLLLGEVKDGDLHAADFEEFAATALMLRPDRAAIFVNEEYFLPKVNQWSDQFRAQLATFGIQGELFVLPRY